MALIICPDCNHKVSSKAATCPHCGCPIEMSNFEPVNITNKNANEIIRYAELAQSAISGNNGDEAYNYIIKILELDPANIDALEMKLSALQLTSTLENLRIQEILECGASIIRYSPENLRIENQHKLYSNRKAQLLEELKSLGVFQFSKKKELQSQLDAVDKDILAVQKELDLDRD